MKKIQIYDPPMCCSTGVCGPSVDEKLVRFAADLDWLKSKGVTVERYNLSQQPDEFVKNIIVKTMLEQKGNECLPLIITDNSVVHTGSYPEREALAWFVELSIEKTSNIFTSEIRELVAIGAAIACNCEMCFKFHFNKARKLGVSDQDMIAAVETGLMVKNSSAQSIKTLAYKYLKIQEHGADASCCSESNKGCC